VGADRVVTLDVHNLAAYQNAFRIRAEHLEARNLFADSFGPMVGTGDVAVVSPDIGGVKRAEAFREALERRLGRPLGRAFMEKSRSEGVVSGDTLVGDVSGPPSSSSMTSSAAARLLPAPSPHATRRARAAYLRPRRTDCSTPRRASSSGIRLSSNWW
jgi:hypothetical protein